MGPGIAALTRTAFLPASTLKKARPGRGRGARPKALRAGTGVGGVRASQDAYPEIAPNSGRNGSSHSFKKSSRCSFACRTVSQPPWSAKRSP